MWKAQAGLQVNLKNQPPNDDDDWETDPDFVNDVTEEEQRWGSTTIEGSGRTAGAIDMNELRRETEEADALKKKKELSEGANSSFGYGGKFGVEQDRMDRSAVGHDYISKVEKHTSQKDYSTGFGGKFGVQNDRVDKSAMSWDHKEKIEKHASQKDYASGFGGKFGVQTDRQDKSAVGWDHVEKVEKHESQKDYSRGFGGKFGVQSDRQDKSAVGWDHHEAPQKHESQTDHKVGFGGKFGVQTDRMDKSAVSFGDEPSRVGTTYIKTKPDIGSAKPSELRAKFEHMNEEENVVQPASPTPAGQRSNVHARAAAFNTTVTTEQTKTTDRVPKQLDHSKTAFLTQSSQNDSAPSTPKLMPGQLDQSKVSQFTAPVANTENSSANKIKQELEEIKLAQQQKVYNEESEQIYENLQVENSSSNMESSATNVESSTINVESKTTIVESSRTNVQSSTTNVETTSTNVEETQAVQEDEIADTGLSAIALYDYQASADDEISFDPDDLITHVERIDEGWWRGMCKGRYGLFPANYVQLQ